MTAEQAFNRIAMFVVKMSPVEREEWIKKNARELETAKGTLVIFAIKSWE